MAAVVSTASAPVTPWSRSARQACSRLRVLESGHNEGEVLALLGAGIAMNQQVGEERLDARRVQRGKLLISKAQVDASEQGHPERRLVHVRPPR